MANISSLYSSGSTSGTSSLYGSRNILSGLASGLDTETMIENSILGYKTKIQSLIGQQTKLSWKQDAYRNITDKLIAVKEKFTSYTSKTNLSSNSFFNNAVKQATNGKNASKVAATGRTNSEVQINAVRQLATAARYSVDASKQFGMNGKTAAGAPVSLSSVKENRLTGSLELTVGSDKFSVDLGTGDAFKDAEELAAIINKKLGEQEGASEKLSAKADGNSIKFVRGTGADAGDAVWISAASGKIASELGIEASSGADKGQSSVDLSKANGSFYETKSAWETLSNKTVSVTLDGVTKKISLGNLKTSDGQDIKDKLISNLQDNLKKAFGDKVSVELTEDGALSFETKENNSTLKVSSEVGGVLGLGNGLTNYLDTSKTLGDLLGKNMGGLWTNKDGGYDLVINDTLVGSFTKDSALDEVLNAINRSEAGVKVSFSQMTNKFTFTATETGAQGRIDFDSGDNLGTKLFGKVTRQQAESGSGIFVDDKGDLIAAGTYETADKQTKNYYIAERGGKYYRVDENGIGIDTETIKETINIGTEEDPFWFEQEKIVDKAIDQKDAQYAKILQQVREKARAGFTAGTDAVFNVTVNGENMELTRSSNVVEMDGLSVTLKNTFNEGLSVDSKGVMTLKETEGGETRTRAFEQDDAVTFTSSTDADVVVDAVKSFVEQINDIMKTVHDAYSTQPLNKSSSANKYRTYEPLTDEDKADMSESEIKAYEEKAQTGLLFGDGDLSRLYNALRNNISLTGADRIALESIGLTTTYESGVTTFKLDEDRLRAALTANPDSVRDIFTKSKENGAATDGLMAGISRTIQTYASTSIGNYGILVNKAGTKTKTLTLNSNVLQKQIDRLDAQIDSWQTKMSKKIDYYTRQFTTLEKLMNTMNEQSSSLAGLMGY